MNIDKLYPSKYMKAADLPEETVVPFVIEKIRMEEVGRNKEEKLIIYFVDQDKGFCCNKTNSNTIAKLAGSRDTDDWIGKTIRLYRAEVEFGGELVESIRVSIKSGATHKPEPSVAPEPSEEVPW